MDEWEAEHVKCVEDKLAYVIEHEDDEGSTYRERARVIRFPFVYAVVLDGEFEGAIHTTKFFVRPSCWWRLRHPEI